MTTNHSDASVPDGFVRRHADVSGTRISFLIGGQGPALVLLHGWPETATSWRHLLHPLAEVGHTVVAPDLRATGGSQRAERGYDKDNQAEDVRALLRHLSLPTSVRLVGHDVGGMVAFAWARRYRRRSSGWSWPSSLCRGSVSKRLWTSREEAAGTSDCS